MNSPSRVTMCPSRHELSAFTQGNLPLEVLEAIAEHLGTCASCASAVGQEDDAGDALLQSLRLLADDECDDDAHLESEMAALEACAFDGPCPHRADSPRPKRLREYELLEVLSEGGMGAVYRAVHTRLGKVVALKTLAPWRVDKPNAVARFRREMKAVGQLGHPNIVQATDAGEVDGTHFLVMEYVEGCDLAKLMERVGPVPVSDACELIRQAALGLEYAHQHGLVHRDIKPSNLLLSRKGEVKLLDLGLARLRETLPADDCSTTSSLVMGSYDYMSPEQADDPHAADARADLYSLGCTLYYLLVGAPPFPAPEYRTAMQKLKAHAAAEAPPADDGRPDVPVEVAQILQRLLAKNPADRFATAAELGAELEQFSRGSDLTRLVQDSGPGVRDARDTAPPTPITRISSRRRKVSADHDGRGRRPGLYAIAVALLAVVAITVISVRTDVGTIEIVSEDPQVQVVVERGGEQVTLIDLTTNSEIELRSGKYHLRLDGREDLKLVASDFELQRGEKVVARVRRKAARDGRAPPSAMDRTNGRIAAELVNAPTAADALRRENIPAAMLAFAGGGNAQKAPDSLVGVFGQRAYWCGRPTFDVCFSPDGKRLACATYDHQVGATPRVPQKKGVPCEVKVFDVETGEELMSLKGHQSSMSSVEFSPDGRRLASAGGKMVKLWNATDGEELRTLTGFAHPVSKLAFSPDGRRLATVGGKHREDGELKVWDTDSGRKVLSLEGHSDHLMTVAFSRDGTRLASAGYGNHVKLWNAETGEELRNFGYHQHWIHGLAFSPDGTRLATAGYDGYAKIWNLEAGQPEHTLKHPWCVTDVAFSRDGKHLATACFDRKVRLFDGHSARHLATFDGHCDRLTRLEFSPDGKLLALAGVVEFLRVWDVDAGRWHISQPHQYEATAVAVSPDAQVVASGSNDKTVRLWDLATAKHIRTLIDEYASELVKDTVIPVRSLAYDRQGEVLVSAHENGMVKIWDPASGALRGKLPAARKPGVLAMVLRDDGELLATSDADGLVKLWNPQTGAHLHTLRGHAAPVRGLALSEDGLTLASGSEDGVVRLWDPATGAELRRFTLGRLALYSLAFVAGDQWLAVGGDSVVTLHDIETGEERHILSGNRGKVRMAYHPARWILAACSAKDQTIQLWDLSHDPPRLRHLPLSPSGPRVESLAFTPEGRYLITGNSDGTLHALRLEPPPE